MTGQFAFPPGSTFTYQQARVLGVSRRALGHLLDEESVTRVARGVYAAAPDLSLEERWASIRERHLGAARHLAGTRPNYVLSHTTAGLLHGLAVTVAESSPIEFTVVTAAPRSHRCVGYVVHHDDSLGGQIVLIDGLAVTDLDRTIADLLRTRTFPAAVAALDDALRRGLTTVDRIQKVLDGQVRWRGRPRALGALTIADPARETWLESYSFAALHLRGIPLPLPQVEVYDENGKFAARVDGMHADTGTFDEADGTGKYFADALGAGLTYEAAVSRAVAKERRRHDRLLRLGLTGARWMGHEIRDDLDSVVSRVAEARAQGRPELFRGWVKWEGEMRKLPLDIPRPELDLERLRYRRTRRRRT